MPQPPSSPTKLTRSPTGEQGLATALPGRAGEAAPAGPSSSPQTGLSKGRVLPQSPLSPRCPDLPLPIFRARARLMSCRTRASRAALDPAMLAPPGCCLWLRLSGRWGKRGGDTPGRLPPSLCSGRASGICHPAGRRLPPCWAPRQGSQPHPDPVLA